MILPDLINGAFESFGSLFILLSVRKLYRDKIVRGVSYLHVGFFTAWGAWNIYYYPYLGQWASFAGGCLIATTNTIYLSMLIYYLRHEGGR